MSSVEPQSINSVAAPETGYRLSSDLVREIVAAAEESNNERARMLIAPLHVADVADLIDQITTEQRQALLGCLRGEIDPEILTELDGSVRDEVLHFLAPQEVAEAVTELDTDDAVELLEDLNEDEQREVLAAVPAEERAAVEEGLGYAEDSLVVSCSATSLRCLSIGTLDKLSTISEIATTYPMNSSRYLWSTPATTPSVLFP